MADATLRSRTAFLQRAMGVAETEYARCWKERVDVDRAGDAVVLLARQADDTDIAGRGDARGMHDPVVQVRIEQRLLERRRQRNRREAVFQRFVV